MKKIYTFLAIVLAAGAFSGCNGFLDREPLTDITPEKYFKSADELAAYTINYYNTFFPNSAAVYNPGRILDDAYTDNLVYGDASNSTAIAYFSSQNTHWLVEPQQKTSAHFQRIRICNYFFQQVNPKLEDKTLSGADVNHYVGEMYVMRAQAYFQALRTFGDFPIIEDVLTDNREELIAASKREPRNKVARFILSDLDKAAGLLENNNKQRITKDLALLLKSRVALYEATFEKYHKGSGRVPGDANWPGSSRHAGESFNIEAEVSFFLDQCLEAASQVADAHTLAANTGVINPGEGVQYGWNPYFEMFSQPNPGTADEVLLWRQFDKSLNIVTGFQTYILEGGNAGATRSHVDGFLMKNGLPIYAAASEYKGDESLNLQQKDRDERLQLFVFSNSDILYPSNRTPFDAPLFMPPQVEHHDRTGFRIRKSFSYDPAQSEQAHGSHVGTNGTVLFRAAEAYLNYIEAFYEKNGAISGKADTYWRALRRRAGVDEDYNKTIAATDLSKEDDWGKRSGETLVDATLFNIRRERRCEFIGEGFRWDDLIRWRSFDHLMTEKWIPEGVNLWGGDLYRNKAYMKVDAAGNPTQESAFIECGDNVADANISARTDSKYVRPLRLRKENNELFDGYSWHKAYYLSPYGIQDLTLTSEDGTVENSVAYQNPYWPVKASEGALE